ncbi:peptidoglycan-binding domain-containing protein [Streptomyces ossamyceticus]|jgi:peptidoglycan hydrolase-like protein with peptidoglycan-binding domain|uniref:peptidoglycan-binding domain-containing protein n=1 Tax=Streptomyces ossamyceticus TaxID=249581 RepID=UPI0007C65076|nr:peptidoglycan-binding protein [Streptomyces ossamyceticus]
MRRSTTCVTLAASLVLAGGAAVAVPQSPDSPARTTAARAAAPERPVTHGAQDVCNYTIQRPALRVGSAGNAVRQAQCYLNNSMTGRKLVEDGNFGSVTNAATRRFQQCAGITVDGTIGAQTWSFLVFWANSWRNVC